MRRRRGGSRLLSSMTRWGRPALVACLGCGLLINARSDAQATAPAPDKPQTTLTPGALYKQALHPLDVVRSSMNNWSDSETAAFLVGVRMARDACGQASPENYSGGDLYDLARLCSLGQDWELRQYGSYTLSRQSCRALPHAGFCAEHQRSDASEWGGSGRGYCERHVVGPTIRRGGGLCHPLSRKDALGAGVEIRPRFHSLRQNMHRS